MDTLIHNGAWSSFSFCVHHMWIQQLARVEFQKAVCMFHDIPLQTAIPVLYRSMQTFFYLKLALWGRKKYPKHINLLSCLIFGPEQVKALPGFGWVFFCGGSLSDLAVPVQNSAVRELANPQSLGVKTRGDSIITIS